MQQATRFPFISHALNQTKLVLTLFSWFQPTNQSDWCKVLTALLEIPTTSQLTIDVDEMLWHAWSQKSHCYVIKFRFTSLYDKMAAARVVLSDNNMSQLQL